MMNRKVLSLILVIWSVVSCSSNRFNDYVEKNLESNMNDSVEVDLCKIVDVPFSDVYFVGGALFAENVSEIIGFKYHGSPISDDEIRLLIISDNRVVYQEDIQTRKYDFIVANNDMTENRTRIPRITALKTDKEHIIVTIHGCYPKPYLYP